MYDTIKQTQDYCTFNKSYVLHVLFSFQDLRFRGKNNMFLLYILLYILYMQFILYIFYHRTWPLGCLPSLACLAASEACPLWCHVRMDGDRLHHCTSLNHLTDDNDNSEQYMFRKNKKLIVQSISRLHHHTVPWILFYVLCLHCSFEKSFIFKIMKT